MLAGKALIDYMSLFSPDDKIILSYFKMSEATNTYSNLRDQPKFRLNEINKIKD